MAGEQLFITCGQGLVRSARQDGTQDALLSDDHNVVVPGALLPMLESAHLDQAPKPLRVVPPLFVLVGIKSVRWTAPARRAMAVGNEAHLGCVLFGLGARVDDQFGTREKPICDRHVERRIEDESVPGPISPPTTVDR